jgi:molecular chaperone Hsp33
MSIRDDIVMPFEIKPLGVRGRLVRLGPVADDILRRHDYPAPVSALLAEAVALTALLGSTLKFDGKLILQTRTDGPVDMIVADFLSPDGLRAYARFDKERVAGAGEPQLLGAGHLALTIDQGADMERYQGVVPLGGVTLTDAAHSYFIQSEQIPTRIRLAAGPLMGRGPNARDVWRAGAIMVQHLPEHGPPSAIAGSSGDVPPGREEIVREDDSWVKARLLLDTVEDHELIDPLLSPEELLYRLYHEDGVTVYPASGFKRHCTCSRERIEEVLKGFPDEDRRDMVKDGEIAVTCEFCSAVYTFPA